MQQRDESGMVQESHVGTAGDLARLLQKKIEDGRLSKKSHVVIAPIPDVDTEFEVNGIVYVVYYVNKKKGEFHSRIKKLVEAYNDDNTE